MAGLFLCPSSGARRISLDAGEMLIDFVDRADVVVYIHSGEVRVFQQNTQDAIRLAAIFGGGEWIGAAAIAGISFPGNAQCHTPCDLSILPVDRLMDLLGQRPEIALIMLRETASRLMRAYSDAARLTFDDCNNRLLDALLDLAKGPTAAYEGTTVSLKITHQQLSQIVGAARETVTLALTDLRRKNLLTTGRNKLTFNPDSLRDLRVKAHPPKEKIEAA